MPPIDPNAEKPPHAQDTIMNGRAVNNSEDTIRADLAPRAPEVIRLSQRNGSSVPSPLGNGPVVTQQSTPRVNLPMPPAQQRPSGARQRSYHRQVNARQ